MFVALLVPVQWDYPKTYRSFALAFGYHWDCILAFSPFFRILESIGLEEWDGFMVSDDDRKFVDAACNSFPPFSSCSSRVALAQVSSAVPRLSIVLSAKAALVQSRYTLNKMSFGKRIKTTPSRITSPRKQGGKRT
jgi:hypothetical protein